MKLYLSVANSADVKHHSALTVPQQRWPEVPYKTWAWLLLCWEGVKLKSFATYQGRFQMHAKISASFGVEFLLELFVLWVVGRPIGYDKNRLDWGEEK